MRAILNSRTLTAVAAALGMALIMGFHVVAQTDPPTKHQAAAISSLAGSSCQHPYRLVKNLHNWYNPAHHVTSAGFDSLFEAHHIGVDAGMEFRKSLGTPAIPAKLANVKFGVGWWFIPQRGRVCRIRITFQGLPTFVSHRPNGGTHTFNFPRLTERIKMLEVTAAR